MASAEGCKKMITLKSSDGEEFMVEEAIAMESQTIRHMVEDNCVDNSIPLPNVNSKILAKVIEYCNKHVTTVTKSDDKNGNTSASASAFAPVSRGEDLKNWDANFVKVNQAIIFDLILAANFLNIKGLLDLTCQLFEHKEIRKTFNIKNDFSPEEEDELRRENPWAFK